MNYSDLDIVDRARVWASKQHADTNHLYRQLYIRWDNVIKSPINNFFMDIEQAHVKANEVIALLAGLSVSEAIAILDIAKYKLTQNALVREEQSAVVTQ